MNNIRHITGTLLTLLLLALSANTASGVDIMLREKVTPVKSVIVLGDIADVQNGSYAQLQRLKLTPLWVAPPVGEVRHVTPRQVFDALVSRGYQTGDLNVAGAPRVMIGWQEKAVEPVKETQSLPTTSAPPRRSIGYTAGPVTGSYTPPKTQARQQVGLTAVEQEQLNQEAKQAVVEYLEAQTGLYGLVEVDLELPKRYAELIAQRSGKLVISGGREPWIGRQTISLEFTTDRGPLKLSLPVASYDMTPVLVAIRPIDRGQLITAADVAVQTPVHKARISAGQTKIYRIEEALGKEASRSFRADDLVTMESCLQPTMVERNALVEVIASGGGITVRRQAKALGAARLGDVIEVELLDGSREKLVGRVVGANKLATIGTPLSSPSPVPGQATAGYR
ncbi:flagellar basal body P-ring formation chaperone FlgA [Aeoliella mucimassa]|uniref:Flagellar basal body P-ring biosynthesis protein FlgA n=1 Tax=Aeoliella mucimassa TaxID=2527972 RepID=A0A518ARV1_9BACT|nr:flagellar basal body P-ring formation chaperone FlgA [Aeoliella mucimassa]QDU57446.1 flagellar basal body P-ring biosynthesis protein FlgA [Aeoliella mucimassa]